MFTNIKNFTEFKAICVKGNVEFHTYMITSEKILTVVPKDLIRFLMARISENIRCQGLNLMHYVKILTHTKYAIYRVTFAPRTTLTQINHVSSRISKYTGKNMNPINQRFSVSAARRTVTRRQIVTKNQCVSNMPDNMTLDPAAKP